jgi:hypothetical protein
VEAEGMEAVVKPTRHPDYVTPYGSAYWWNEMIYMSPTESAVYKMRYNEDNGELYQCGHDGLPIRQFAYNIKNMYNYWLYGALEEAMLEVKIDD